MFLRCWVLWSRHKNSIRKVSTKRLWILVQAKSTGMRSLTIRLRLLSTRNACWIKSHALALIQTSIKDLSSHNPMCPMAAMSSARTQMPSTTRPVTIALESLWQIICGFRKRPRRTARTSNATKAVKALTQRRWSKSSKRRISRWVSWTGKLTCPIRRNRICKFRQTKRWASVQKCTPMSNSVVNLAVCSLWMQMLDNSSRETRSWAPTTSHLIKPHSNGTVSESNEETNDKNRIIDFTSN